MGGLFDSLGYSKTERFYLYFVVCIWIRLMMAIVTSRLVRNQMGSIIVGCFAALAMWVNFNGIPDTTVWWSRRAHFLFATGVLLTILLGKQNFAGPIIVGDTVFGIVHTLAHHDVLRMCPIF